MCTTQAALVKRCLAPTVASKRQPGEASSARLWPTPRHVYCDTCRAFGPASARQKTEASANVLQTDREWCPAWHLFGDWAGSMSPNWPVLYFVGAVLHDQINNIFNRMFVRRHLLANHKSTPCSGYSAAAGYAYSTTPSKAHRCQVATCKPSCLCSYEQQRFDKNSPSLPDAIFTRGTLRVAEKPPARSCCGVIDTMIRRTLRMYTYSRISPSPIGHGGCGHIYLNNMTDDFHSPIETGETGKYA